MINYIVQVLLFQIVFLAVYDFVLKKETFFQWNRAYLLVTSVLAYTIPLIKLLGVSKNIPQKYRIMLPEVILSPQTYIEKQVENSAVLFTGFQWLLITGGLIAALIFIYKIIQIIQLIRLNRKEKNKDYNLVFLSKKHTSFSFFRYIFLGNNLTGKEQIIAHELVHVKQKHSIDLLFFELQKILFWFNPFSYLYQNRMAEIHEFIADAKTVSKKERSTFYNSLLVETFRVDKLAFVNSYNKQSIIKKRIMMFSKEKSKEILKLKYILLIPILMGMGIYTSCRTSVSTTEEQVVKKNVNIFMLSKNKPDGKLISFEDLSSAEKTEYRSFDNSKFSNPELYRLKNGEIGYYYNDEAMNKIKKNELSQSNSNTGVVAFGNIDQAPIFPGCEDADDQRECFVQNVTMYIARNFDVGISKNLGLEPGKKNVYVQFQIDKTGKIVGVRARGPHVDLEEEAVRVVSSLPKMQPGEENGKKVGVKYTLPITLVVD